LSTAIVVIGKLAVVCPAGIETDAGIVTTEALLHDRVTVTPPAGAGALKVMVPVEGLPPDTA